MKQRIPTKRAQFDNEQNAHTEREAASTHFSSPTEAVEDAVVVDEESDEADTAVGMDGDGALGDAVDGDDADDVEVNDEEEEENEEEEEEEEVVEAFTVAGEEDGSLAVRGGSEGGRTGRASSEPTAPPLPVDSDACISGGMRKGDDEGVVVGVGGGVMEGTGDGSSKLHDVVSQKRRRRHSHEETTRT
jgi:hypothetical protein